MKPRVGIPVSEAAARLGVHRTRVNKLIRSGAIEAIKLGSQYLVDIEGLDERLGAHLPTGRPLTQRNAWALLGLASRDPEMARRAAEDLTPPARSRLRGRLSSGSVRTLAPRLRTRARVARFRADPADLATISSEPQLVLTGVSAAPEYGLDIVSAGQVDAYVPSSEIERLRSVYVLEPSARPNITLRVVDSRWPFRPGSRLAPAIVAALDLFDSRDARERRAGSDALERLETG